MKVLLVPLHPGTEVPNTFPADWSDFFVWSLEGYSDHLMSKPDLVVLWANQDPCGVKDSVLADIAKKAGVTRIAILTDDMNPPAPDFDDSCATAYFCQSQWANGSKWRWDDIFRFLSSLLGEKVELPHEKLPQFPVRRIAV